MPIHPFFRTVLSAAAACALLGACSAMPYAGFSDREIKALSAQDQQSLLEGRGMSLALAAELNGYPGPTHVLEHAHALKLSEVQRTQTEQLMQSHKARVRGLGAQLIEAERNLDRSFASKSASNETVEQLTLRIGQLQAQIRADHLLTHLAQTQLLHPEQVRQYRLLRGYSLAQNQNFRDIASLEK
jgi:hypothetical protein